MDDSIMKYRVSGNLKSTISGKYIYLLLSELSGEKGKIQISISKISYILKVNESTVRNNLHRLESKGYIFIKEIYDDDGTRKANEYILK
ncbi:MAG: hypothetical protein U9Q80_04965 [Bacillota bacterium]|nr:hypothetical protein [Bacillota bacterium]